MGGRDPETYLLWSTMNGWVYQGFDVTYQRMGVDFDKLYYESDTFLLGKDQVMDGLARGIFIKNRMEAFGSTCRRMDWMKNSCFVPMEPRSTSLKILVPPLNALKTIRTLPELFTRLATSKIIISRYCSLFWISSGMLGQRIAIICLMVW